MPTGYTAGILDGKITTFEQFAINCMRAFGATIHMRDEPSDKSYEKRAPSTYYQENIEDLENKIIELKGVSNEDLVNNERKRLLDEIERLTNTVVNKIRDSIVLNGMLSEVQNYNPPTPNHEGIKKFMVEQLKTTIEHDCDIEYYSDLIKEYGDAIIHIDAKSLREKKTLNYIEELDRLRKNLQKDIEVCDESNQWVEDFLQSLRKSYVA